MKKVMSNLRMKNHRDNMRRADNMSTIQKEQLIEYLTRNPKLVHYRFSQDFSCSDAQSMWLEITQMLNKLPGSKKTWKQWRKCWQDMKTGVKSKHYGLRRKVHSSEMTSTDEKILYLISLTTRRNVSSERTKKPKNIKLEDSYEETYDFDDQSQNDSTQVMSTENVESPWGSPLLHDELLQNVEAILPCEESDDRLSETISYGATQLARDPHKKKYLNGFGESKSESPRGEENWREEYYRKKLELLERDVIANEESKALYQRDVIAKEKIADCLQVLTDRLRSSNEKTF